MYKTVAEVTAALNEAPDQSIVYENYDGKKYISWDDSVRELNRIFGPFGWSTRAVSQSGYPAEGVYLAAIEVSVTVLDDETAQLITVTRAGFGRAVAQPSRSEQNEGHTVSPSLQTHDTAASAAGSDALSKATKLLGTAFGLAFYGEAKRNRVSTVAANRPAAVGTVTGRGPSDKQMAVLVEHGYTAEQVQSLSFAQWKGVLDAIFAKQTPAIAPAGQAQPRSKRPQLAVVAEADDIPF